MAKKATAKSKAKSKSRKSGTSGKKKGGGKKQEKIFYKIGEVCSMTDTEPYVLRYWESEFPELAPSKNRSGQRIYAQEDVDMVLRIKELLYDEGYTIAGARRKLEEEVKGDDPVKPVAAAAEEAKQEVDDLRAKIRWVRTELQEVLELLS